MWKFNHSGICYRGNTAGHNQSRGILECIDDSFLTEVIEELTIGDVLLDLILINKENFSRM